MVLYILIQKSAFSQAFDIRSATHVLADDAPLRGMHSQFDVAFWANSGYFVGSSLVFKPFWQYDIGKRESHVHSVNLKPAFEGIDARYNIWQKMATACLKRQIDTQ